MHPGLRPLAGLALVAASAAWRAEKRRVSIPATMMFAMPFIAAGSVVFSSTNIANAYETPDDVLAWKAAYETSYEPFARLPRPAIRNVKAAIDLEPEAGRYRVRGAYTLVNESTVPIDTILIGVRRDAVTSRVAVSSPARITRAPGMPCAASSLMLMQVAPGKS